MSLTEFNTAELEELQTLLNAAFSPRVKKFLESAIHQVEANLQRTKPAVSQQKCTVLPKLVKTYGWAQSDGGIDIYIDVSEPCKEEDINVSLTEKSLSLTFKMSGLDHALTINKLFDSVIPNKYKIQSKSDKIRLTIYKEVNKHWDCVSAIDVKPKPKVPKMDEKEDPSASMMNMMKKLYDEGDDEMKRTISKAWSESQEKIAREPLWNESNNQPFMRTENYR